MIAIDLSKQQALDDDPEAIQQINFTGSLEWDNCATIFFVVEEAQETVFDFSQETVKILWIYFTLV